MTMRELDIVEALRRRGENNAAAEIERLRAIADTDTPELKLQHEEILQLRAEIERLRKQNTDHSATPKCEKKPDGT